MLYSQIIPAMYYSMTDHTPTQAMVLAAGLGKRMRPLNNTLPKPMVEVAGRTLIDRAIDRLETAGITKVVVNTSYLADILEAHLRQRPSPKIVFSREAQPLETGGGIARALHHFGGTPFFAVNSDVIWLDKATPALKLLAAHWSDTLDALLLLHPAKAAIGYEGKGDFFLDTQGNIRRRAPDETAPYIYTGIQLLHPRLFADCPSGVFSLNILYNKAMQAMPPRIKGIVYDGELLNVGDPEGQKLAETHILKKFS